MPIACWTEKSMRRNTDFYPQIFFFIGTDFLFYRHGLTRLFYIKRHGWAARWEWLYLLRAILESIDTALSKWRVKNEEWRRVGERMRKMKLSRELAKQAVTTKCRGLYQCGAKAVPLKKPCPSVPKNKHRVHPCLKITTVLIRVFRA